jgi:chemotaxis response regulator CheB
VNAVIDQDSGVSVALLGPADAAREQLRKALQGLGANLVFEGELLEADKLVRERMQPAVLIINLEPGVEDDLDALQDLLDHPETSVVFNEGEVSSQLTGWDLARWARHLAAKVLGVTDTLPPPPSGAERLPTRELLPEPGRPTSPAQQQEHLDFDRFAGEVFQHQDGVPSSLRLDREPELAPEPAPAAPPAVLAAASQPPTTSAASEPANSGGFDFDFSPVQGEPAAAEPEPEPVPSDNLESMDLSSVFEQDLGQLSPEALLAKLQQAMGLEPVHLPEDAAELAAAPATHAARVELGLEDTADQGASDEAAQASADTDAVPEFDFNSSAALDSSAPKEESLGFEWNPQSLDQADVDSAGAVLEESMELDGTRLSDAISSALDSTPAAIDTPPASGTGFDPVSAEFEDDFSNAAIDELSFDAATDSLAGEAIGASGDESSRADAGVEESADFDFDFSFDSDSPGDSDAQVSRPSASAFEGDDASLGGTLTLEGGADDDEIARLAAALDEAPSLPSTDELPSLEFDFEPRREREEPPAVPPAHKAPEASKPAAAKSAGFGELSLTPMDQDFIDPSVEAPLAQPPERNFDFSKLTLSLEPIEEPAPAARQEAGADGVQTMRDGAWLRDLDEVVSANTGESASEDAGATVAEDTPSVAVAPPPVVAPPLSEGVSRVIVLCASIGGPDAVRSFLAGIPAGFPALFVVVQHLENGFFARLAQQLQKTCKLTVSVPTHGHRAADAQVLVVNAGERFLLATNGTVELTEPAHESRYRPCIDDVLDDVSEVFGANATAIIFSGMAADAVEGAVHLTQRGGEVWVQDPESCVVSSMVDGARARGVVEFIGSPRELAEHCVRRFGA